MAVTIQNLDVQFDVEGEGDEETFARLFARHARQWEREREESKRRERRSEAERSLGDRPAGGGR